VWEITGAEFTNQGVHTADGISIRFPRVTRIRHDKDWSTATTLDELRVLFQRKPDSVDFDHLLGTLADVKDVPKKKLSDPANKSPRKLESVRTSSWDEPSTSSKIKNELPDAKEEIKKVPLPERALKRRKGDERDEGSDKIRSERKRSKVKREIKEETENPSSTRCKTEGRSDSGTEGEDRCIGRLAGGTEGSFESSFDASASDSNIEDTVNDTVSFSLSEKSSRATSEKFLKNFLKICFFTDKACSF